MSTLPQFAEVFKKEVARVVRRELRRELAQVSATLRRQREALKALKQQCIGEAKRVSSDQGRRCDGRAGCDIKGSLQRRAYSETAQASRFLAAEICQAVGDIVAGGEIMGNRQSAAARSEPRTLGAAAAAFNRIAQTAVGSQQKSVGSLSAETRRTCKRTSARRRTLNGVVPPFVFSTVMDVQLH